MGNCLSLNLPKPPQIPFIFLSGGLSLSLSLGSVGVTCCNFKIPIALPQIKLPIPPAVLIPLITVLNALIASALPVLDTIQIPTCPLDEIVSSI